MSHATGRSMLEAPSVAHELTSVCPLVHGGTSGGLTGVILDRQPAQIASAAAAIVGAPAAATAAAAVGAPVAGAAVAASADRTGNWLTRTGIYLVGATVLLGFLCFVTVIVLGQGLGR